MYLKPTGKVYYSNPIIYPMENFFSTLKKWRTEEFGKGPQVDSTKEYIIEYNYPAHKSGDTLIEDLISYSESTGERFPLEKRLEEEGAQMRPAIKNLVLSCIEVAYQISKGNFDEIANNSLQSAPTAIHPGIIDFLLDNFPEEFNKALRAAPKENWEHHVFSCKYGCGKGSGYYDPYLDFRYVKPPEILELEDPRDLRKCKWPAGFDPGSILIRFTKNIKLMKWS